MRTNERIRTECRSETRAVEGAKNRLLAVELHKLLNHDQGILNFLENCGSVVALRSLADANSFVPHAIQGVEDVEWIPANRPQVREAGLALHQRLCPGNQIDTGDVLKSVASWSFQIPPGPLFSWGRVKVVSHWSTKVRGRAMWPSGNDLKENIVVVEMQVHRPRSVRK